MLRSRWRILLTVITVFVLSLDSVSCGVINITAPGYGGTCNQGIECDEPYKCIEGSCACPFPRHQYPDTNSIGMPCRSYVGGPCLEEVEGGPPLSFRCVDRAECGNSSSRFFTCQCSEGYIERTDRTCKIAFGQPCTNFREDECDPVAGLTCQDSVCSCPDFQQYDASEHKCRGLVGSLCDPSDRTTCVIRADCNSFRGKTAFGFCHCSQPYSEQPDRTCR